MEAFSTETSKEGANLSVASSLLPNCSVIFSQFTEALPFTMRGSVMIVLFGMHFVKRFFFKIAS